MKEKNNIREHNLFPVKMWLIDLSDELLDREELVKEAYRIKNDDPKGTIYTNNGGWQSQHNIKYNKKFEKLNGIIDKYIMDDIIPRRYSTIPKIIKKKGTEVFMNKSWLNISEKYSHNNVHTHNASWLSGIVYLKVSESMEGGEVNFIDPVSIRRNNEHPDIGQMNGFTGQSTMVSLKPTNSLMVLFPSWLAHSVEVIRNNCDRISYSFDYNIEGLSEGRPNNG